MKKLIFVVLIALVLTGGMVLVSCKNPDCPGDGKCEYDVLHLFTGKCYNEIGDRTQADCFGTSNPSYDQKCGC